MIEIETRNTRQSISSEHELNTVIIHAMSSCYVVMLCRHAMLCYVVMLCRRRTQSTSYNSGNSFDKLRLLKTLQVMSSGKGHQNTRQLVSFGKELQNTRQVDFRKRTPKHSTSYIFRKRTPKHSTSNVFREATQNSRQAVFRARSSTHTQQTRTLWQAFKTVDNKPRL